jgi:hypothetical protein
MDCVVVSWLYNTVSADLLDVIHECDGVTARVASLGIEQQFLNNRESRAMILDAEFRNFCQGSLSIDEYCRKMKTMADALADLGEPLTDRTMVMNILRGLNERFQFVAQLLSRQRPFPSFVDVRADLRLAELTMGTTSAPPTALVASSSSRPPAPPPLSGVASPRPSQSCWRGGWRGIFRRQPQPEPPWWARPEQPEQPGRPQQLSWCCLVALPPQPMDWVHPYVARLHHRRPPRPSAANWRCSISTAARTAD